ncbi:hypothetical protein DV515_00005802 [Chloebia gouldiae]|uniref:Uncharacterized protein n=1 Tax=Chloebia gouldiae TaxID=44316 RepID=A0A3L8SMY0_CHLGU|nr:hypothetical protein DV515_00005802 [Chloebia gouldiae]
MEILVLKTVPSTDIGSRLNTGIYVICEKTLYYDVQDWAGHSTHGETGNYVALAIEASCSPGSSHSLLQSGKCQLPQDTAHQGRVSEAWVLQQEA